MIRQSVNFQDINVIPYDHIQVVGALHTSVNQITGQPEHITLQISIDKEKAESETFTATIYVPVAIRNSKDHKKLLATFHSGEPFVAVSCKNFKVFRKRDSPDMPWNYYGFADGFEVVDYEGGQEQC